MLSTVHSAKGQEWDAVYVLNVADGNFPVGVLDRPAGADRGGAAAALRRDDAREERSPSHRAAQVLRDASAAKRRPARLRREQPLPDAAVMATLSSITWPNEADRAGTPAAAKARVNVAGKLRGMW